MLTFELSETRDQLEIHANEQGLKILKHQIEALMGRKDHVHLMTPSWGGVDLTEELQGANNELLNQVTIYSWPLD